MRETREVTTSLEVKPNENDKFLVRVWNSLRKSSLDLWKKSGKEGGVSDEISARLRSGTVDAEVKLSQIEQNRTRTARETVQLAKEQELFELEKESLALKNEKTKEEIQQIRDERLLTKIRVFREAGYNVTVQDLNGTTTLIVEDTQ